MPDRVDVHEKVANLAEPWVPRIIAQLNGQYVKVGKAEGEYVWHRHEAEDEMFMVVDGVLDIHLRDRVVTLEPGQLFVVTRGTEHKPVGRPTATFLLFEPVATRNTGDVDHALTIEPDELDWI